MDETPNTISYMIGGFTVFTVVIAVYIFSYYSRWRALREQEQMLKEMKK